MKGDRITVSVSVSPDPGEYPEEAAAWDHLVDKVRAFLIEARTDPNLAAIADELDPGWSLEVSHGPYRATPRPTAAARDRRPALSRLPPWCTREAPHHDTSFHIRFFEFAGAPERARHLARDLYLVQHVNQPPEIHRQASASRGLAG